MIKYISIINRKYCFKYEFKIISLSILLLLAISTLKAQEIKEEQIADSLKKKYILPNLDTVYNVLYAKQRDGKTVASVGYLKGDNNLISTFSSSFYNALTGRIAGLYTQLSTGLPGSDVPTLKLRGLTPLIIVDGVPRSAVGISADQIESITVLKDALSAGLLGNRGGNGAVLITTKNGKNVKGYSFTATAQSGVSESLGHRKSVSAFDFANLYNEALANDGKPVAFSSVALSAYQNHSDPYLYPDVNWQKELFKDSSPFSQYTISSEGSNNGFSYFIDLDYMQQNGMLKEAAFNNYNTNTNFERFTFRTNLSLALTKNLEAYLNVYNSTSTLNEPGVGFNTLYNNFLSTPANAYPILNPNGSLAGNATYQNNLYGQSLYTGYLQTNGNNGFADFGLKMNMDEVLKGWWIKTRITYNVNSVQDVKRNKNFQSYQMQIGAVQDTTYQIYGANTSQTNTVNVSAREQQFYAEGSTGYEKKLGDNNLNLLLMYNYQNYRVNSALPERFNTVATRISYDYKSKYVVEATGAYSGDSRFKSGNQYNFYPAIGVSWNVEKESFLKQSNAINALKLRASYGKVGNADPGYFSYLYSYTTSTGAYVFGSAFTSVSGAEETELAYSRVASEALKFNVGLDLTFAKNRGYFSVDYFNNAFSKLLQIRGTASSLLGITTAQYPLENIGKRRYFGSEFTLGWADKIGKVGYNISGNLSVNNSEVVYNDEPNYALPWLKKTGQPVNQIYGYTSVGYIKTAGETGVVEGYSAVPGDVKYKDLNNDGVINQNDVSAIGSGKPLIFYGLNFAFNYKNFDVSFLIQGVMNNQIMRVSQPFGSSGTGTFFDEQLNRWTPATSTTATSPRLTVGSNSNNYISSTVWLQNNDFFRLKNASIGYNFQGRLINKLKIKNIRLFVNGLNLLTSSDLTDVDPENLSQSYPIQRVINGGITVSF